MAHDSVKTAVVGAGYVGIATAVGLAEQGRDILLVEQDPGRLAALLDGRTPFHEPGLPDAYAAQHAAGRIVPSAGIPGDSLDLIVICVGTPIGDTGYADLSYVARALEQATPAVAAGAACVIRSTLPVGSATRLAKGPGVVPDRLFVAPEFLRQGSALADIRRPSRVVVGTFGERPDPAALALVTGTLARRHRRCTVTLPFTCASNAETPRTRCTANRGLRVGPRSRPSDFILTWIAGVSPRREARSRRPAMAPR